VNLPDRQTLSRHWLMQANLNAASALLDAAGEDELRAAQMHAWAQRAGFADREPLAARLIAAAGGQLTPGARRQLAADWAAHGSARPQPSPPAPTGARGMTVVEARIRAGLRELLRDAGGSRKDQALILGKGLRQFQRLQGEPGHVDSARWPTLEIDKLIKSVDAVADYERKLDDVLQRARSQLGVWQACARRGEKPLVVLDLDQTMLSLTTDDQVSLSELVSMPVGDAERLAYSRALQAVTTGRYTTVRGMVELVRELERREIPYVYVSANDQRSIGQKTNFLRALGAFGAHALAPRSASRVSKHTIYAELERSAGYSIKAVFDDTPKHLPSARSGNAGDTRDFKMPTLVAF
jgi:hypothetical protein